MRKIEVPEQCCLPERQHCFFVFQRGKPAAGYGKPAAPPLRFQSIKTEQNGAIMSISVQGIRENKQAAQALLRVGRRSAVRVCTAGSAAPDAEMAVHIRTAQETKRVGTRDGAGKEICDGDP